MTTRRKSIQQILAGVSILGTGGLLWGITAKSMAETRLVLRPPGAGDEKQFVKACIKCGQCVEACPYDTLKLATLSDDLPVGTPHFSPREIPCYMCTDIPCTTQCPSDALNLERLYDESNKASINEAQMGLAVIHQESCIAHWGIQCDACYRACPLIGEAIELKFEKNKVTGKHANMIPIVNSNVCTGCGVCEHACVVEKAAIFILPRNLATGEVGNHYIKSWDKKDESRIQDKQVEQKPSEKSTLDYLNNEDELFEKE